MRYQEKLLRIIFNVTVSLLLFAYVVFELSLDQAHILQVDVAIPFIFSVVFLVFAIIGIKFYRS